MTVPPGFEDLPPLLAALPPIDRKVVGGLVTLLAAEPGRARDQEWIAERFVALAVLAHGPAAAGEEATATSTDVERMQAYARARMPEVVGLALRLFIATAEVLRARRTPFGLADVRAIVLELLGPDPA